jgi:hypothetical protein
MENLTDKKQILEIMKNKSYYLDVGYYIAPKIMYELKNEGLIKWNDMHLRWELVD